MEQQEVKAQRADRRIEINLFGGLEIRIDGRVVSETLDHSKKLRNLLAYLILHKNKPVSNAELFEMLWPNEESTNPGNALKTLLSRLRNALQSEGAEELKPFILTQRGSYQWDPNRPCSIDVFDFKQHFQEISENYADDTEKLETCKKALRLYHGDLLPKSSTELWVVQQSAYYHDMYLNVVRKMIFLLNQKKDFDGIIKTCQKALTKDVFCEELYLELITALIELGKSKEAMLQYNHVTDLFFKQLGVQPSEQFRALYKKIAAMEKAMELDIDIIKKSMEEKETIKGAFIFEYEIFKNLYHLEARCMKRTGDTTFIGLITAESHLKNQLSLKAMNNAMEILLECIRKDLRKGDVISRYSLTQFVLLLPNVTYETGEMVLERIILTYKWKYPKSPIFVSYKLRPLTPAK